MKQLVIFTLLGLFSLSCFAQEQELAQAIVDAKTPEAKGLAIAKMLDYRDTGWQDLESEAMMVLYNRSGKESKREMRSRSMEVTGDGDKSLSIFDHPRTIKGTATLTWSHGLEPNDQWLYLPALKRVKRVSSKNKSGPFMGSEFAYEDLSSLDIEKYTYKYLRDENLEGKDCYVIDRYPAYEYSGYTRRASWIDKELFIPYRVVFYDRKNVLLKTQDFKDYKQYLGKYWRPDVMTMQNHQTGKSSIIYFKNYKFANGFTARDFDKTALKRLR